MKTPTRAENPHGRGTCQAWCGHDCEAGFPSSSRGDLEGRASSASDVRDVPIAALARAKSPNIEARREALTTAASSRASLSCDHPTMHLQGQMHMTREQALEAIGFDDSLWPPGHVAERSRNFPLRRRPPHRDWLSLPGLTNRRGPGGGRRARNHFDICRTPLATRCRKVR